MRSRWLHPSTGSWAPSTSTSTLAVRGTRLLVAQWWAGLRVLDLAPCLTGPPRRLLGQFCGSGEP